MQPGRIILCSALLLATALTPCVAMTHTRRGPTSPKRSSKPAPKRTSGQHSIDDARAAQIQQALVKSGYMTGASGHWDGATESAMQKFQSDNGWQTRLMPDSRAIIKLGLGPSKNSAQPAAFGTETPRALPETASTTTFSQQ
jgi:hypothetical protein